MSEQDALSVYQPMQADVAIHRPPAKVLEEARQAAQALTDVISKKAKPVKFNGETYLEFEDWQTVARFYGITARARDTKFVQYDKVSGFEASADALLVTTGQVISSADAMCLNDEPNWSKKPMFQLRSMAQTRACAKALRNVLSWVVVLAGYKPTPAEEMDGVFHQTAKAKPKVPVAAYPPEREAGEEPLDDAIGEPPPEEAPAQSDPVITDPQRRRMYAIARNAGMNDKQFEEQLKRMGFKSSKDVTRKSYEDICTFFETWKP